MDVVRVANPVVFICAMCIEVDILGEMQYIFVLVEQVLRTKQLAAC